MKDYVYKIDMNSATAAARMLRMVGRNKRVLEIGSASGNQTRVMREQLGCTITALEYNDEVAEGARPYCEKLLVGSIEEMDLSACLEGEKFDVVTFGDVLEHLRNPVAALSKVRPFIDSKGYVVASIPNIVHASVVYEMCHGRFDYSPTGLLDDTHIHFFTKRGIAETFEAAGYFVSVIERAEKRPESTEFQTRPASQEQSDLLDYIFRNNPESLTYQFVIIAYPNSQSNELMRSAASMAATERIKELESIVSGLQSNVNKLNSQLSWVNNRPFLRLYRRLTGAQN